MTGSRGEEKFVGSLVQNNRECEKVGKRQAGRNRWRKVSGVMKEYKQE